MEDIAAALREWQGHARSAVSGELRLDPSVAEDCRHACEQFIASGLQAMRRNVIRVDHLTGFGGFPSGDALRQKFEGKADGGPDSFRARVDQHIEVVKMMQLTFAMSCAQLTEKDVALRDQLAKLTPEA